MLDFPKKRDKTSCLLRNMQQVSFHVYRSFGIIHVKCYVRMYLVFIFLKRQYEKTVATTPRCRGGCYSFPWIAPLYPWSLPYNAECWAKWDQVPFFEFLVWTDLGLNPSLLDHWQTLGSYPLHIFLKAIRNVYELSNNFVCVCVCVCVYIHISIYD